MILSDANAMLNSRHSTLNSLLVNIVPSADMKAPTAAPLTKQNETKVTPVSKLNALPAVGRKRICSTNRPDIATSAPVLAPKMAPIVSLL
jgi:hypothetical protein